MINQILEYYTEKLEEFLKNDFHQPEGIVEIGFIGNSGEKKNKLIVSLLSIERETAGGISPVRKNSENIFLQSPSPIYLNLYIVLAAIYDEKRYTESLSVFSKTLYFIQSVSSFKYRNEVYTVEVVPLSFQELYNIWTNIGGQYYPSVLCKLRRITIDSGEIFRSYGEVNKPEIKM